MTAAVLAGRSATGTIADTDIDTDAHGLPVIRQSRLNKRLREAAILVTGAHPDLTGPALDLLGRAGADESTRRWLLIRDAVLPLAVRRAVAHTLQVTADSPGVMTADQWRLIAAITGSYTCQLAATSRDLWGVPEPGTLRVHQAVRAGVVFTAPLLWRCPPDRLTDDHRRLLRLSVAALRQMGGLESDAYGRVTAELTSPGSTS